MITTVHPPLNPPASNAWIEQLVPPDRQPARWEDQLHHLTWSFIRRGLQASHSLDIRGAEHFPDHGPSIIVANHNSHLDTLLLGSVIPRPVRARFSPLAAGDTFFRNPSQSWLSSRLLNLRPLWREKPGSHNLSRLRASLIEHPSCLLLFPEGTRSRSGTMGHFKPGVGMLVAGTNIPVIPCHIRGTFEAWPCHRKAPKGGQLRLRVGPPRHFPGHSACSKDWRHIAHELEEAVRGLDG